MSEEFLIVQFNNSTLRAEAKEKFYNRENAVAKCEVCNGPIYSGDPVTAYMGLDGNTKYVHKFTTWCTHYQAQEALFLKSLGIGE
jgi:hypothetical protein